MGFYTVACSDGETSVESAVAVLAVGAPQTSRLVNLAVRAFLPPGEVLTAGLVRSGDGDKQLLLRAVGPTLARFGVAGALSDPALELIPAGERLPLAGNDDWSSVSALTGLLCATLASGAFALDAGSKDAALVAQLPARPAGNATVRIRSTVPTEGGQVLAEIYDADGTAAPGRLAGLSVLGFTGPGEQALLPGFTIAGSAPKRVLLRAVGPGLATFGIAESLSDPQLTLFANGLTAPVAESDNWTDTPELLAAAASVGAFALRPGSRDAAMAITLPPGGYTASIRSGFGTTGIVLLEIYDLDP
jgi:hypothetical protein